MHKIFEIKLPHFFSTLKSFCNLSSQTIDNQLFVFNSTTYTTKNVQRRDLFKSQTQQFINIVKQATRNLFFLRIQISRQTMSSNALYSGVITNYKYESANYSRNLVFYPILYTPNQNNTNITCSCKFNPYKCTQASGFYQYTLGKVSNKVIFIERDCTGKCIYAKLAYQFFA